jgi:hypothetical protein
MGSLRIDRFEDTASRGWRHRRGVKLAIGGVLATAAPLALASPASAAYDRDDSTVEFTYETLSGASVTCRLNAFGAHETSEPAYVTAQSTIRFSPGTQSSQCRADHLLTFRYRDGNENEIFSASALDTTDASFTLYEGDVSNISIEHSASFTACDELVNETCIVTTTTSPK